MEYSRERISNLLVGKSLGSHNSNSFFALVGPDTVMFARPITKYPSNISGEPRFFFFNL